MPESSTLAQHLLDYPDTKVLWVTVGLPRSGKSTWSRLTGWPMVNPDSIRLAMYGKTGEKFLPDLEGFVWATAETMVKSAFITGHQNVVFDATSITPRRRQQWRSRPGITPWDHTVFVYVNALASQCKINAEKDDREDLIPVIERMDKALELHPLYEDRNEGNVYSAVGWNFIEINGLHLIKEVRKGYSDSLMTV